MYMAYLTNISSCYMMKMESLMDYEEINSQPFEYTLELIGGKWKMPIIFWLGKKQVMRYGELKKALGSITHKMLSNQLKELAQDGLILRTEYPQIPPKVEYWITDYGKTLQPILEKIGKWGEGHRNLK